MSSSKPILFSTDFSSKILDLEYFVQDLLRIIRLKALFFKQRVDATHREHDFQLDCDLTPSSSPSVEPDDHSSLHNYITV